MTPKIEPGRALVLVGPQGSGKTKLARELAQPLGEFVEVDADELEDKFQHWMHEGVETVIVDGLPFSKPTLDRLKAAITSGQMQVNQAMRPVRMMRTPNFVFCTGELNPLKLSPEDRRFLVVQPQEE